MDVKEYDLGDLKALVDTRDIPAIQAYMTEYDLVVKDGKIVPKNPKYYLDQSEYWDMQQLIAKIKLNSLYGCILNEHSKFYDSRIGQSVTLTGRQVVRHLMAKINELVTGEYNHLGTASVYGDTDSSYFSVYKAWKDAQDNIVIVNSDDQFRIVVDAFKRVSANPESGEDADTLRSLTPAQLECLEIQLEYEKVWEAIENGEAEQMDELIAILNTKVEAAFPPIEIRHAGKKVNGKYGHMAGSFNWECREDIIKLYDAIAEDVNETFPDFMNDSFNTGTERGSVIAAGREIVAENALFLKKKRYAALIIDSEGKRYDVDGKPGKLKAMGLETKRSDTPTVVQEFLEEVLIKTLKGIPEKEVLGFIKGFVNEFKSQPGYYKGRPSSIKGLTKYNNKLDAASIEDFEEDELIEVVNGKVNMPGHVRAAINFNDMLVIMNDKTMPPIKDGDKIMVCQLRANPYGIDNIARPVDVSDHQLPTWFKELPFDHQTMENSMIDVKIDNIIGILGWDLESVSTTCNTFNDLFSGPKQSAKTMQAAVAAAKPKKQKATFNTSIFG